MRRFRATIEYDGTGFAGFQYQTDLRTVQSELELALGKIVESAGRVDGAGRTDAGVHALGQVISFSAETRIPEEKMATALNSALPLDVRVVGASEVEPGFHARFSAKSRLYVYVVLNRMYRSAILGRYTHQVPVALDERRMAEAAAALLGTHDFRSWANSVAEARTTVRRVMRCDVRRRRSLVVFRVEANAFLHGMVRNIVGTLLQVGSGRREPEDIGKITELRDRSEAGPTAPANGLYLLRVTY